VASTTNHAAPTLSASASSPLATYVLMNRITPFLSLPFLSRVATR